ncbi:hypothetical protein MOUN0_M00144 [Monosporozyma unispora]
MALCMLSLWKRSSRYGPPVNGRVFPVSGECAARIIPRKRHRALGRNKRVGK